MCSSFVLELTDKFLVEEQPNPKLFNLVIDFFESIERRTKKHEDVYKRQVTHLADRKSRQYIRKMKRVNPDSIVAVTDVYKRQD